MRMTRKIRRAWLRGKPEWAKCYLLKQRLRKQNKVKSLEEHKNRLHGYSRYLVAGVVLACLGMGQATQAYASNITVKDSNYAGTVVSNGNVIDVYNQQVTNGSALNKFTNFELSQSDIANMHLDAHNGVDAANRQINLVDNKVTIDGVLNAYKNGQIGGDIYFFSDKGIAIGSTGVVNVGSLTLGTSVSAGQNIYEDFTSYNNKSSLEKAKYIAGDGEISIGGSINATDNVTIGAKKLTASGDAKINSGVDFSNASTTKYSGQSMSDYRAQFMNMGGANKDALAVIAKGDEIVLYGQSGVEFSSKDYISITGTSTNNVKVTTNGGDVEVRVDASDNVNAEVSIENAQVTSNGGDINVSLINNVRDDVKINITNSTLDATSNADATLSDNANGNVSISASTVAESLSWAMRGNSATVDISNSTVKGDNVSVSAIATLSGEINGDKENTATDEEYIAALDKEIEDEQSIIDWVYDLSGYDISELRSLVAVTVVEADSKINITDSTLEAVGGTKENKNNQHGNININTYADSQIVTLGLGFINFGTTLGFSDVVSKVNIIDSNIKAKEDINIDAYGKNKIDLDYIELSFLTEKVPATVVFNMADLNSDVGVYVDETTTLSANNDVSITSKSVRSINNYACAGGSNSYAGVGASLTMSDTKAISDVRGNIYANGDIGVSALNTIYRADDSSFYEPDTAMAESFSGDSFLGKALGDAFKRVSNVVINKVVAGKGFNLNAIPGKSNEFGINAATAVVITDSEAKAAVTGKVAGYSEGNTRANSLNVDAETVTRVNLSSMAFQNTRTDAFGQQGFNKDYGVALGVNVGIVENTAEAIVGGNVKVNDLNGNAKTTIPWETSWSDTSFSGLGSTFLTVMTSRNLGANKLFDSWAQSNNATEKVGGAGAVTYLDYTNNAKAYIAENAEITVDDEIHINAINDTTTVNFSGIVSTIFKKNPVFLIWEDRSAVLKDSLNILGTNSEYGTLGGAVAVIHHDNNADAYVADGATISTKTLDVDAKNRAVDIVVAGNGGKSETVSVDAAVSVINTQNSTNAYIGKATVTASDDVNVDALDENFTLNIGGTIVEAGAFGIGATVAYNYLERNTNAFINGNVNSGDSVFVNAKNTGEIISATIAGSITCNANTNNAAGSQGLVPSNSSDDDNEDAVADDIEDLVSDVLTGAGNNAPNITAKTGFGVSANVAFNDVTDNASAYVATLENKTQNGTENTAGTTQASVTAKRLNINSINDTEIVAAALTASVNTKAGASTGIAGSYMQNSIVSENEAYLYDAIVTATGTTSSDQDEALRIEAANKENIINVSVGGSIAPKGNNVLGQVSNNILKSNTKAYIKGSTVNNDDVTTVKAYDNQDILLVSGAVTVSGSYAGVGAAVGVQQITADTNAFVKDSTFVGGSEISTKGGDVNVVAEEMTDAFAIVATGSFGAGNAFASADSSGTNIVDTETKAYIENSINLNATNINVAARNIANSTLGVGGISQSNNAVGVSLANNLSTNLVEAYVQGDANKVNAITADSLSISARNIYNGSADEKTDDGTTEDDETSSNTAVTTESTGDANTDTLDSYEEILNYLFTNEYDETTAKTVAVGAAIANNTLAGVGSETLNQITNTTKAHLDEGKYSVTGGLNVDAQSEAYIFGLAGGLSAAENVGIGASVDYEDINITTEAYVNDKVNIDKAGSITVKAESIEDITSIAVSAGGGKYFAGAFNAGVHDIHIDTNAHVGSENIADEDEANIGLTDTSGNSTVGKITIDAKDDAKISANAGGGTLQVGGAGVASSLGAAVEVLEKNVSAYIGKAKIVASEIDIDAINQGEIINTASELAIAVSNGVGLSGAASENFVTQNTKAYVADGSQITIVENNSDTFAVDSSDGNSTTNNAIGVNGISIKAQGNFKSLPVVVGAGVGSLAAGGAAHAYMDFEGNTFAYVGDGAIIKAGEKLEILAENDLDITVGAGVGSGSKYVSGNGAIGLVDVDNSTYAWIGEESNVSAQRDGITVKADDHTKVENYNETLGVAQGGSIGAAVQVNNISKDTQAYVKEAAVLNSKGNIVINAESSEDLFNNATQADGAQYVAAGASVIVNDLELVTKAFTDTSVQINVQNYNDSDTTNDSGNITIIAHHLLDNDNVAVGVAGSQYANAGAGVDVTTVSSHVNAFLGNGNIVESKGNLNVVANEELGTEGDHMISTAVGVSGAEFGSGNGSVSVGTFNSVMSEETQNLLNSLDGTSFNAWVSETVQEATTITEALDSYEDNNVVDAVEDKVDSTKYQYDITGVPSTSGSTGVLAMIGQSANVIANDVNVDADDNLYFETNVGSGSAAGIAGGAAVAVVESDTNTKAIVDDGAGLYAEGIVTVDGKINHNLVDATIVGANVAVIGGVGTTLDWNDNSDVSAIFKASEIIADSLLVHSDNVIRLEDAVLTGASVNGIGGNGVELEVNVGGSSTAEINRDDVTNVSNIETTGLTKVFADANVDLDAKVIAPTVGIVAGAGTGTYLSSGVNVKANVYDADIDAGEISFNATTTPKLHALSTADIIGGAAVGLTFSEASIKDTVTVNVGDGVELNAKDAIDIATEFKNPEAGYNAYVEAFAGSGGVLTGAVTSTKVELDTKTLTNFGKNIQISGKTIDIKAVHKDTNNYFNISAEASGVSGKGSESYTTVKSDVDLSIDDNTSITSSETTVIRAENETIKDWLNAKEDSSVGYKDYNSLSAGASVVDGTGIVNETTIEHTTDVNIGKVTINANAAPVTEAEKEQGVSLDDKTALEVSAYSNVVSKDYQYIGSGAVIEAAYIDGSNIATSTTNINISDDAKLYAGDVGGAKTSSNKSAVIAGEVAAVDVKGGKIVISASNEVDMYSKTYVDVWGAVNYAGSENDVKFNSIAKTNVAGVLETANGDIVITSGRDVEGNSSDVYVTAESDILNGSIIPISTYPKPSAIVNSEAFVEIADTANVLSDGNVYLQSNAGVVDVSGIANTKDWVNDVVGELNGATGGQVGYSEENLTADVKVDGYVETGIHRNQSITIGGTNEVNSQKTAQWITAIEKTAGVGYELISSEEVKHQLSQRLEDLRDLRAEYSSDSATVAQYDKEIAVIEEQMVTLGLGYREADGTFVEYNYDNNATERYAYLISGKADDLAAKIENRITECNSKINDNSTTSDDKAKYETIKNILEVYLQELNSDIAVAEAFKTQGGTVSDGKFVLNGSEVNTYSTSTETSGVVASVSYIFSYDEGKSLNTAKYANVVQLDDVVVKLGDIVVEADNLYGEGTLNAATNAAVTITNLSPNDLVVNDIKIVGSSTAEGKIYDGGNITFNGSVVESDNDIVAHNKDYDKLAGFTFAINDNNSSSKDSPVVNVSSEFNPNHYLARDLGNSVASTSEKIFVAPTLTIANGAEIYNANGGVNVESDYGDVKNNGTITAATVNIAINNGDYVQTDLSNRITNVGGNPEDIYADSSRRGTGIFANGNVIITARYVNINSTIQSGKANHSVTIPENFKLYYLDGEQKTEVTLESITAWNTGDKQNRIVYVSDNAGSKIDYITYDVVNSRFVVEELVSRGGKIEITGTILNTDSQGNGKIIALDGYGSAKIINNTNIPIELRGVDVGEGNKGTIVLTDLDRETGKILRKTTYGRENDVIIGTVETYAYNADGTFTTTTTSLDNASVYKPAEDLYYVWQTGQETTTVTEYHYSDSSFAWWWDAGEFSDDMLESMDVVSKQTNAEYTLDDGTLVSSSSKVNANATETTQTGSDSNYKQYQHTITDYTSDPYDERVETSRKWYTLWLQKEYDHYFKIKEGTTTITQNSLKASHDIAIGFEGSNTGAVTINGLTSDVIINGVIDSGVGAVDISGANIIQGNDGFINANIVNFGYEETEGNHTNNFTVNNIGAIDNPIITNATKISGLGSNNSDNAFAVKVVDNGTELGSISGFDTVSVSVAKNITQQANSVIAAKRIELESESGGVGTDGQYVVLNLDTTGYNVTDDKTKYGLKVSADDDIYITNQGVNLYLDSVISEIGDVTLKTNGSVLDNNFTDTLDENLGERLSKYKSTLEGTDAASYKQKSLLATKVKSKYNNYQSLKESIDENGNYVLDENVQKVLKEQYNFTDEQISEYVAKKQKEYDELVALGVGSWSEAEVKAYIENLTSYVQSDAASNESIYANANLQKEDLSADKYLTQDEKAQVLVGSARAANDLLVTYSPALVKEVTDTHLSYKKVPNVQGKNITLEASGGIGAKEYYNNIDIQAILAKDYSSWSETEKAVIAGLAIAEKGDITQNGDKTINIARADAIDIDATGKVNLDSEGSVFVVGNGSINIDKVVAVGEVRLKFDESINGSNVDGCVGTVSYGENIILESANGSISGIKLVGSETSKFNVVLRAANDISVGKENSLNVASIYTENGNVILDGGSDVNINGAVVGGDMQVSSGVDTNVVDGKVDGKVTIESSNATIIGNITSADLTVNSQAGKTVVGNAEVTGDVVIGSGTETEVSFMKAETVTLNGKGVTIGEAIVDGNTSINSTGKIVADAISGGTITLEAKEEIQLTTIEADGEISILSGKDVIISTKDEVNSLKVAEELTDNRADFTDVFIVGKVSENDSNFADDTGKAVLRSSHGDIRIEADGKVAIDKLEASGANISVEADMLGIDNVSNLGETANEISIKGVDGESASYVGVGSSDGKELLIANSKVENAIITAVDNAGLQNVDLQKQAILKVGGVTVDVKNSTDLSTDVSIGELVISGNDITATNTLTSVDKTLTINGSHRTPTVESVAETLVNVADNSDEKFMDTVLADVLKGISQNHADAYGNPKEQHQDIEIAEHQPIIDAGAAIAEQMVIVSGNNSKKVAKTFGEIHIGNEDDKEDKK